MSEAIGIAGPRTYQTSDRVRLYLFALVIAVVAEFIGSFSFTLGPGKVVMLPMVWALLIGAAIGMACKVLPGPLRFPLSTQWYSSAIVQPALLLLVAKLGLLVGASLPKVVASGWALIFQEFGHFFGTAIFGLPVALLLGILNWRWYGRLFKGRYGLRRMANMTINLLLLVIFVVLLITGMMNSHLIFAFSTVQNNFGPFRHLLGGASTSDSASSPGRSRSPCTTIFEADVLNSWSFAAENSTRTAPRCAWVEPRALSLPPRMGTTQMQRGHQGRNDGIAA